VRRGPGPFGIGYDWFHQGESLLSFYVLTMAAPDRWRDRAQRFADLYVDPAHGNYDSRLRIVRARRDGSGGARDGVSDTPSYPWLPREAEPYATRWTGWLPTATLWQRWTRTRDSVPRCSSVSGEVTRSAT
jgi:hypothetical protein